MCLSQVRRIALGVFDLNGGTIVPVRQIYLKDLYFVRAGDRRTVLGKDLYKTVPVGDYVGPTEDKTFPPPPVPQPAPRGLLIGKF